MSTIYTTHPRYIEHTRAGHPEHAGRMKAVWQQLDEIGLSAQMQKIVPQPISNDLILTLHTPDYLNTLQWIASSGRDMVHLDPDTYATSTSFEIARLAAGGVTAAIDAVLTGEADNGLAAIRPPGHHAMPDHGMGFCLLGNIALGARHAQQVHPIERVLIVDYDVHHGNGTQAMFDSDDSVLFISTHQYPFYPGTGALRQTGTGAGKGYTINIPLSAGHGDKSYAAIYQEIIWPAAERFQPQLILVSAGFDAHWDDPLASMRLSLDGYNYITRELVKMANQLCDGKIVFVMEGGYNLGVLAHGVENIAHTLLRDGRESDPLGSFLGRGEPDIRPLINQLKQIHEL
ncbi:MAG: histone deacetylase [Anaerolineae bacterium]|nr:histone deacetylase [Anaerolineae bacterium]